MRYFSTIAAPLNELIKNGIVFKWGHAQEQAFKLLKEKLTHATLVQLSDFASSVRLLLLQEAHGGGLVAHFGAKKTKDVLAIHFFWTEMRQDIEHYMSRCTTCNLKLSLA